MSSTLVPRARIAAALLVGGVLLSASVARAQAPALLQKLTAIKQAEVKLMWQQARLEMSEAKREAREARLRHGKHGAVTHLGKGDHVEGMTYDEDVAAGRIKPARSAGSASVTSTETLPTNVLLNDKTPDLAGAGQAEQNFILLGNQGVAAWNDGQGFNSGGDVQTLGYSVDGGATWQRTPAVSPATAGAPPHFTGSPADTWTSDPVVSANEKTGQFWYSGLIDRSAGLTNGVGAVSGTISGSTFTWGTPTAVKTYSNTTALADKEWFAADSATGNVYSCWTKFDAAGDHIMFSRSTNGGASWSAELELNSAAEIGYVQGSRVAVGPAGEVYVVWYSIGSTTNNDFIYIRKSTNGGLSFGAETQVTTLFSNFGTGAPGFNRPSGITFPSIGIDRSTGPHRGRVYVAFEDAVNWYDDPVAYGANVGENPAEVGTNDTPATAIPFHIGDTVHGNLASNADLDYFSFAATQGSTYIFWCDSLSGSLAYTMRIFCTDGATRLAYSGATTNNLGANGFIVWTAPASGTYYLRLAPGAASGDIGGYRVLSGIDNPSGPPQRGRDQRDDFVAYSDNGTTWSTPSQINDDAPLYDNFLPEVGVGLDGNPYVMWYDWRDAAANCGGVSNIYISRSDDGGNTWEADRAISTAQTNWTTTASNIAPNQGDYQGLYGGAVIAMAWGDGRLGDADVWGTHFAVGPQLSCVSDTTITGGATYTPWYNLINPNAMFDDDYSYSVTVNRSWPGIPIAGNQAVTRLSAVGLTPAISVPDTAATGDVHLCVTASVNGAAVTSCCSTIHVVAGVTAVGGTPGAVFALSGARPNPSSGHLSVAFSLPDGASASLELVDVAGRRVYQSDVGGLGAGFHVVSLENAHLPAGLYAVRLTQHGRVLTSKVAVVR